MNNTFWLSLQCHYVLRSLIATPVMIMKFSKMGFIKALPLISLYFGFIILVSTPYTHNIESICTEIVIRCKPSSIWNNQYYDLLSILFQILSKDDDDDDVVGNTLITENIPHTHTHMPNHLLILMLILVLYPVICRKCETDSFRLFDAVVVDIWQENMFVSFTKPKGNDKPKPIEHYAESI